VGAIKALVFIKRSSHVACRRGKNGEGIVGGNDFPFIKDWGELEGDIQKEDIFTTVSRKARQGGKEGRRLQTNTLG